MEGDDKRTHAKARKRRKPMAVPSVRTMEYASEKTGNGKGRRAGWWYVGLDYPAVE